MFVNRQSVRQLDNKKSIDEIRSMIDEEVLSQNSAISRTKKSNQINPHASDREKKNVT